MTTAPASAPLRITHYSDLLCVWAYVAQIRVDELRRQFQDQILIRMRCCSVFADIGTKIVIGWKDRGGVAAYRDHVVQTVARFDHVTLHPDTWTRTVPTTSATAHACVKAAELVAGSATVADDLTWRLRQAFFRDGRDISSLAVQLAIAEEHGLTPGAVRARLDDGTAWAALHRDYEDAATEQVRGSPTFLLNERRQTLYGNVGYRVLEANVHEVLRHPEHEASWC